MGTDVVDDTTKDVTDKTGDTSDAVDKTDADDDKGKADDSGKAGSGKTPAQLEGMLEKYGLSDADELDDFIGSLTSLKDKLGSEDVEDLLANKAQLQKIQSDWAKAEEAKRREGETPEETIQRLERELTRQQQERQQEALAKQRAAEDAKLLKGFNSYVSKSVDGLDGLSKSENKFLKKFLGVNNPIHDVELTDTATIKKLISNAAKDFDQLREAIIEDYEKHGKRGGQKPSGLPDTPRMDRAAEPGTESGEHQPKNMRDARSMAKKQLISKLFGGGSR